MDRRLFQEALNRGAAHAWRGQWDMAVEEYRRALELAPEDPTAQTQLAMAFFKGGRLQEASELYQQLWKAQPSNLTLLQRLAEIQETLGDLDDAFDSLQLLGEIHRRRHAHGGALKAWRSALSLRSDNLDLWDSLLEVAAQNDSLTQVMPAYLNLARNLALQVRFEEAIQVVEKAQALDPGNPAVLDLLSAIRRGLELSWRAAASGQEVSREQLAQTIPPIDQPCEPQVQPRPERLDHPSTRVADPSSIPMSDPTPWVGLSKTASASSTSDTYRQWDRYVAPPVETPAVDPAPVEESPKPGALVAADAAPQPQDEMQQPVLEQTDRDGCHPERGAKDFLGPEPSPEDITPWPLDQVVEEGQGEADDLPVAPCAETEGEAQAFAAQDEEVIPAFPSVEEATVAPEEAISQEETGPGGIAIAEEMIGLAEANVRLGQPEEAMNAYERALEIAPEFPRARLGIARLQLLARRLDAAEVQVRMLLESDEAVAGEYRSEAVEVMLELLRERSAYGDLEPAVDGLVWLQYGVSQAGLPVSLVERVSAAPAELLGQTAGDHLDEIVLLPQQAQVETLQSLRRAEELIDAGKVRSAADEMYRLIICYPDFLPSQLLLARVLLVQGRVAEARERARRVQNLYEMRDSNDKAQIVMGWMVRSGIAEGDTCARLAELLLGQNGHGKSVSALPPLAERETPAVDCGLVGLVNALSRDGGQQPSDSVLPLQAGDGMAYWNVVLSHAETSVAAGRHDAAAKLLRTALEVDGTIDEPTRVAVLRILQSMEPNGEHRRELEVLLARLGFPQELAD